MGEQPKTGIYGIPLVWKPGFDYSTLDWDAIFEADGGMPISLEYLTEEFRNSPDDQ